MKISEIHIRDPFVVTDHAEGMYTLFGTTGASCWGGTPTGFDCYRSTDLNTWEGPIPAFRPPDNFWANRHFWAPEVHPYNGQFYMFASFKADKHYRGTQILIADQVTGPYSPITATPVTPPDWECLDGTLHVAENAIPWIVFCHEWVQIHNGAIYAMPLTPDLTRAAGRPVFLFNASEAPWGKQPEWPSEKASYRFPTYVTDGPFLWRLGNGALIMLWSSFGDAGYTLGTARSETGHVTGPWHQDPEPLWTDDGGHGMIFSTLDGTRMLTFHSPNARHQERPVFVRIVEDGNHIRVAERR